MARRKMKDDKAISPITGRATGRPRKEPPADAAKRIEELAAGGSSLKGVGLALRASGDTLGRWLDEDESLREAYERGREKERHALHNMLYESAMAGDKISAMFLLKARHGYIEGQQDAQGNRVNIVFQLPGAMKPEHFTIESEHERITETVRLPNARAERS